MLSKSQSVLRSSQFLKTVSASRFLPSRYASQVVTMPALSPTMTSGKIAKWTKKGEF